MHILEEPKHQGGLHRYNVRRTPSHSHATVTPCTRNGCPRQIGAQKQAAWWVPRTSMGKRMETKEVTEKEETCVQEEVQACQRISWVGRSGASSNATTTNHQMYQRWCTSLIFCAILGKWLKLSASSFAGGKAQQHVPQRTDVRIRQVSGQIYQTVPGTEWAWLKRQPFFPFQHPLWTFATWASLKTEMGAFTPISEIVWSVIAPR